MFNYTYFLRLCGCLTFLVLSTLLSAQRDCPESPSAQMDFSPNAITTSLLTGGDLWWNGNNGRHRIALPDAEPGDQPLTTIFSGGLWLSATTSSEGFVTRVQQYGRSTGNFDFSPGPLSPGGLVSPDCGAWDKFFPITQIQVDSAIAAAQNGLPVSPDLLPSAVLGWPGAGNPYFNQLHGFDLPNEPQGYAPFLDKNQDGIYDPTKGDLPLFRGDEAVWLLFSTARTARESQTPRQLPMEIHLMAYGSRSENDAVDQTIFYDYKFISRAQEDLIDFQVGQIIDSDLGCGYNDLAESIPEDNLFYVFNRTATEPEICGGGVTSSGNNAPLNIFQFLNASSFGPNDDGSQILERFYFNQSIEVSSENRVYYNFTSWSDGTPLTRGGQGYNPGSNRDTTRYMFDGGDVDGILWRVCGNDSTLRDLRTYSTLFPVTLSPGATRTFSMSVTTLFDIPFEDGCPDRNAISDRANTVQQYYDDNRPVGTDSPGRTPAVEVEVFPNPSNGAFNFKLASQHKVTEITLFDFSGRRVTSLRPNASNFRLDLEELKLPTGTYFYQLQTKDGRMATGKLVKAR